MQLSDLEQEIDDLYGVGTEMGAIMSLTEIDIEQPVLLDDDEDDEEGDDDEDGESGGDEEAREYQERLLPEFVGLYVNEDGELVLEYEDNAVQQVENMFGADGDAPVFDLDDLIADDAITAEYRPKGEIAYSEGSAAAKVGAGGGLLTLEYETPELLNRQKTYQRIVIEADMDGESVYELTVRKLGESGIGVEAKYDDDFGAIIITSVNGRKEGEDGNFNEFYHNGEIGADAAGAKKVSKGDIVEWRYAEETDGSCGGVPDFHAIKSMLMQYGRAGEYSPIAAPFGLISQMQYS